MFQLVAVIPKRVSQSKESVLQPEFEGLLLYQVNDSGHQFQQITNISSTLQALLSPFEDPWKTNEGPQLPLARM